MMTAHDLLYLILDYTCNWSQEHPVECPPAKARLAQIDCMLTAFGLTKQQSNIDPNRVRTRLRLGQLAYEYKRIDKLQTISDLEYVISGEFLHDRAAADYMAIQTKAIEACRHIFPDEPDEFYARRFYINTLFADILEFRLALYKVAFPYDVVVEGFSTALAYGNMMKEKIAHTINQSCLQIDEVLSFILDPQTRDFDKSMIAYPQYDFKMLDAQFEADNF